MGTLWNYLSEFGLVMLLVGMNAVFVATEFAFVKIRASQLKAMRKPGKKDLRLQCAIRVTTSLDRYLSATQLGITLTSLALGWVGEPVIEGYLKEPLGSIPFLANTLIFKVALVSIISGSIAFISITFLHIVLGELVPKYYAIKLPRSVVLWMGVPLILFYYAAYPFIWLLSRSASGILRLMGIKSSGNEHGFHLEELQHVLMGASHPHPGDELVNKIMLKALRLKEATAEHVMIPKEAVVVLWRDKSLEENMRIAQKSGYSRLLYCGSSIDEVLGVVHVKELLWQVHILGDNTDLKTLVRPVLSFMAKTRLPAMLELFRRSRNHLAVVLDKDEKLMGLVSFEDVLEELVGDIRDEFDIEKGPFYERSPDSALVDTDLPLRDLAVEMSWPLPTDTTETVEKWALRHFGQVPTEGQSKEVNGLLITAEQVSARRIRRLRLVRRAPPENASEEELTNQSEGIGS
jgi:CBS domain containing-hemolysin-like protein